MPMAASEIERLIKASIPDADVTPDVRAYVAGLTQHHLRPGFLVHRRPLTRRWSAGGRGIRRSPNVTWLPSVVAAARFIAGEPIVGVVANDLATAREAVGMISVEFEALPFTMTAEGPDTPEERYVIEECEPPRRLVVRFEDPSEGSGPDWVLELDLDDSEGFTTLTFTQAMPDAETASSVGPGWDYYLDRLVAAERGDDLGELDYEQYAADQSEYYRSAFS